MWMLKAVRYLQEWRPIYDDGEIVLKSEGSHALHSRFDWSVTPE